MQMLITGSGGRLGRLLYAAKKSAPPVGCDVFFQSRQPGFDLCWGAQKVSARLPNCDAVVALWGVTAGSADALAANSALVDLSRRVALSCGASTLFHMSSAAVYGPGANMGETAPTAPTNAYGMAKLAMETKIRETPVEALTEVCLRVANVVGADSLAPGLRAGKAISLDKFPSGLGPLRSYIGAGDLLAVFCALARRNNNGLPTILNVAAPKPVAMQALAEAAGLALDWRPAPSHATEEVTLDVSLLMRLLPHVAVTSTASTLIADWRSLEAAA